MTVTGIAEVSKSRSRIEIDHQFAFVLYKGELRQYHLREGEELQESDYRTIMEEVLPKRAKLRCMNLLKSREYTTEQLKTKLRQGQYPEEIITQAIDYVASFHYIDDLRYATDYITVHESTRSRSRIEQDLYRKGLSQATIAQAFTEWQSQGGIQDEQSMIQALLTKKHYNPDTADYKARQKMYAYLLRKGHTPTQIRQALKNIDFIYDG
ncbi:MAG: regulatory protein RecX [Lachnospiraceae bacterium]|nr:regulatory protein RecX [Lachnospiraceae bacterium]